MKSFHSVCLTRSARILASAGVVTVVLMAARNALADVTVFDNLNTPTANSTLDVRVGQWVAQSFTVGSFVGPLSHVRLNLNSPTDSSGNFFVRLYGNSGSNIPASLLETLVGTSNPAASGIFDFTGSSLLGANTTYWVVAGVTSGSGFYKWNFELPANVESGSTLGWTYSTDQGTNWQGTFAPTLVMNMKVTAVPEPSTLVLAGIAATLLLSCWLPRSGESYDRA